MLRDITYHFFKKVNCHISPIRRHTFLFLSGSRCTVPSIASYNWQYFFFFLADTQNNGVLGLMKYTIPFLISAHSIIEWLPGTSPHHTVSLHLWVPFHVWDPKCAICICVCWINRYALLIINRTSSARVSNVGRGGGKGKSSQCGFSWGPSQGEEDYSFLREYWGPGDSGGELESAMEVSIPCGWHSLRQG